MEAQIIVTVSQDERRVAVYHNPDTGYYFWMIYQINTPAKQVSQTEYPDLFGAMLSGFGVASKDLEGDDESDDEGSDEREPLDSVDDREAIEEPTPVESPKKLKSGDPGYWTPERRAAHSLTMKKRFASPETRKKISEGMRKSYERRNNALSSQRT